jgi:hypothetical protein
MPGVGATVESMTSAGPFIEDKQGLTITEVSDRIGPSQDTIRYYEKAG